MAILLAVILTLGVIWLRHGGEPRCMEIPKQITDFTALDIDGNKVSYTQLKGIPTVIVLSASWCPVCITEIPALQSIHSKYSDKGLKILMVSEDDNIRIAKKFKNKYKMPWDVVHWNYDLMQILGNPGVIPVIYVVDKNDQIKKIFTGAFEESELEYWIQKLTLSD